MPELPEVEVLARHLHAALAGQSIARASVLRGRRVEPADAADHDALVAGRTFRGVGRRGKYLLLQLDGSRSDNAVIVVHLGMTGRIYLTDPRQAPAKHAVVAYELSGHRAQALIFEDPRGFGHWRVGTQHLPELGPEPLEPGFDIPAWLQRLQSSRQSIKTRLLDQSIIAGIGNIYANEALFEAGIHPLLPSSSISPQAAHRLVTAIRSTLHKAIQRGTQYQLSWKTPEENNRLFYFGAAAQPDQPSALELFWVYDRKGQPCRQCGATILRTVQSQRSTFHCPSCQPDEPATSRSW